jgi:hypothetical protein
MSMQGSPDTAAGYGAIPGLRSLAGCLAAGLVVGPVVAGLGSRLVMRALAVADPDARGAVTENGNVVGDVTFGGTLALVVFIGLAMGFFAGPIVFVVRRWLRGPFVARGVALSIVLLAVLGGQVLDADNIDFRLLHPSGLAVALFGLLFFAAGFALLALADRWGPGSPRFFYRRDITVAGGVVILAVVVLGLVQVGSAMAEIVS